MPWRCVKCGYKTKKYEGEECPDCGGLLEESESEIDWLGEGEEKDLNNPDTSYKKNPKDDIPL